MCKDAEICANVQQDVCNEWVQMCKGARGVQVAGTVSLDAAGCECPAAASASAGAAAALLSVEPPLLQTAEQGGHSR